MSLENFWISNDIETAIFTYDCGGDSMGDTELKFFGKDGNPKDVNAPDEFSELIYDNVSFYEASDGHYIGEYGTVEIRLREEGFEFNKISTSRFSETVTKETTVKIKKSWVKLLKEKVRNFSYSEWGGEDIEFLDPILLSEEEEKELENISYYLFQKCKDEPKPLTEDNITILGELGFYIKSFKEEEVELVINFEAEMLQQD